MNFFEVLIPIFGVFLIGYLGVKLLKVEVKPIATMALYLMSPFLAFQTFYQHAINLDYVYLGIYLLLLCIISLAVCYVIAYFNKWDRSNTSGFMLATSFMNNGNYGAPLILLVFGETGFQYAVILMVLQQLIMCTIGIYIAAKGSETKGIKVSPLKEVVKVPIVYGAILGIVFNLFQWNINEQWMVGINMVADATIPTVMIILGMQLASISVKKLEVGKLSIALVIRLAIAPVVTYFVTLPLPLDEMVKDIMVVIAAMPTAANTTMYALQFNAKPSFVSSATLTSTLLSVITLPIILALIL
ncbi:AEC family transporter [Aquibacillus sediminis]|uniref:AEC family transporter n=1 Tax=Aquibacillus sediminis TaxID=2574734 RepID=UPI0011085554|nr:AEC family transporter [Aquibacillus sediminis]